MSNTLMLLAFNHENDLRRYFLNKPQRALLAQILANGNHITAPEICKSHNISIQNASTKLQTLYKKNWVERVSCGDPSGGTMYSYYIPLVVKDIIESSNL